MVKNKIAYTNPEMMKYFVNQEDGYKYSKCSHAKIQVVCPICNDIREMTVKNLYYQGFRCYKCDSNISFPNRIARSLLQLLNIDYISEYSPSWLGRMAYDFYFKYNNQEYILEMDGGLGHGHKTYHHKDDVVGLKRDQLKDGLAKEHNINVIRIDCVKSTFEYIKQNILKSKLNDLFDLSNFDWNECYKESMDNLFVKICEYYNDGHISNKDICSKFHIGVSTLCKALNMGNELGLCEYNKELRRKHAGKLNSKTQQKRDGIAVDLYDLDGTYIGWFNNGTSCARKILELYPEMGLTRDGIINAIYKHKEHYKGFTIIRKDKQQEQSLSKGD